MLWILYEKHTHTHEVCIFPAIFSFLLCSSPLHYNLSILYPQLVRPASSLSHLEFYLHFYPFILLQKFVTHLSHAFQTLSLSFLSVHFSPSFSSHLHTLHGMRFLLAFRRVCTEEKQTQKDQWLEMQHVRLFLKHNHRVLVMLIFWVYDDVLKKILELSP